MHKQRFFYASAQALSRSPQNATAPGNRFARIRKTVPASLRPSTWLQEILATMVAASGVGYLATAYTVSRWLTRKSPAALPSPAAGGELSWDSIECLTSDGLRLHGWVIEPSCPRATIALFHGMRGHRAKTSARIAFLTAAGYRCVAFDHRAHGQSEGRRTSFGYYEGLDALAVLEYVRERWPDHPRAALGISMGAAALCFAARETCQLAAVILESLYNNVGNAFASRIGSDFPHWFQRFARGIIWITELRLGVGLHEVAPAAYIDKLAPAPVLFVTGSEDSFAPPAAVQNMYQRCSEPRAFQLIPGAGHANVCEVGGPFYRDLVLDFLKHHLDT